MQLKLPQNFKKIVNQKTEYSGALDSLLSKFSEWLTANKTEFFPEYTDHGIEHVQSVLDTAEEITPNQSFEIMTPEDIYVLTSSIILHDCAMHISREGLWDLLSNDLYNGVLLGFDNEKEWSERWESFIKEVNRFDEYEYVNFFGEYRDVAPLKIGAKSLDDDQKIIIGDFVRKYHACIAQVISTYGIPTKDGAFEIFDKSFNYLNQLSGLIARSHNHSLRSIVDILGEDKKRTHRNTHPTFLMGLLRISDYLQLKSDRTPKMLFNTTAFCSPVSLKEWKKHLSIISTNDFHPDEELIFIEAFPEDAKTLSGIKQTLAGLQSELDDYWAVIGEVYSRYPPLNNLLIKYRRVKSNIDDALQYVETNHKTYYPEVLSVIADNQKLFPLLIKPLYGDIPQIGLRELLQNSLDATNERYSQETKELVNESDIPYDIKINIDLDNKTLELIDNGVGMSIDVIKNYFLKIGSSYRTSEQWKSKFITDSSSKVPRTGKFGIGMLAGFLIGDKITVTTKSFESNSKTIKFDYTLDSSEIELKYLGEGKVGTKICIDSDATRLEALIDALEYISLSKPSYETGRAEYNISSWWYFLDTPYVSINIIEDENKSQKKQPYKINKNELAKSWNQIIDSDLDAFYWRESTKGYIYCNGIMLQKMKPPEITIQHSFSIMSFEELEINIFDNTGKFPLNLTRDGLVTDKFYELEKLEKGVKNKFLSQQVAQISDYSYSKKYLLEIIESYSLGRWQMFFVPKIFTPELSYPYGGSFHQKEKQYILVDFIFQNQSRGILFDKRFDEIKHKFKYSCFANAEKRSETIELAVNFLLLNLAKSSWYTNIGRGEEIHQDLTAYLYLKLSDFNKLSESSQEKLSKYKLSIEMLDNWVIISNSERPQPDLGKEIMEISNNSNTFMFSLYKVKKVEASEFSTLWEKAQNIEGCNYV